MGRKSKVETEKLTRKDGRLTTDAIKKIDFNFDALKLKAKEELARAVSPDIALLEKVDACGGWNVIHEAILAGASRQSIATMLAAGGVSVSERMAVRVYGLWKTKKGLECDLRRVGRPKSPAIKPSVAPAIDKTVSDTLSAAMERK